MERARRTGGHVTYSSPVGLRRLATAEVAQSPSSIPKHAQLAAVAKEGQERLESAATEDIITAVRAVSRDVAKRPDRLFAHIGLGARKKLNKYRHGTSFNNDLGLSGRARGDIRQGPRGLELDESVGGAKELNEAAHDTSLNDFLDRRVALLGEEFPELRRGLDLLINLVGEDARDHLREVLVELERSSC